MIRNGVKKSALIILDGFGLSKNTHGNAIKLSNTPNLDFLFRNFPNCELKAFGKSVGLPDGQMGNSEVGHLNIGAGRVVTTGLSLINKEIKEGSFYSNEAFLLAIQHCIKYDSKLNIMGLVSHGGVHSSFEHIVALCKFAHDQKVKAVLHCFSDGRDCDQKAFINDLIEIKTIAEKYGILIGSISGRYYAMDRDQRWERSELAYQAYIGNGGERFNDPVEYVKKSYDNNITDEFILPAINNSYKKESVCIENNDSIIFANFRPDRARQLSHLIFKSSYYSHQPTQRLENLFFVTMMKYEGISSSKIAYPPIQLEHVLGQVLEDNDLMQVRIAETEKYAHVTFFFDGGVEKEYRNESKILIDSPKVATYDLQPEMSARAVANSIIANLETADLIIGNFANLDMVGHTGSIPATIKAVEFIDQMVGEIYQRSLSVNSTLFITSDHGNADEMLDEDNNIITRHSNNKVPFICTDKKIELNPNGGSLSNIAPTILDYMKISIPSEMTNSLIIESKNKEK